MSGFGFGKLKKANTEKRERKRERVRENLYFWWLSEVFPSGVLVGSLTALLVTGNPQQTL